MILKLLIILLIISPLHAFESRFFHTHNNNQESSITSTFLGSSGDGNPNTSWSFSSSTFGTATADRIIVVIMHAEGTSATSFSNLMIGGTSGTIVNQEFNSNRGVGIGYAIVPAGSSGTISFNTNNTSSRAYIGWWRLINYGSSSPIDDDNDSSSSDSPLTVDLDFTHPGIAFIGATRDSNSSITFTNIETTHYSTAFDSQSGVGGATYSTTTAEGSRTMGASSAASIVGVIWR